MDPMLHLKSETNPRWLTQVDAHLDEVLIDHAHCEKKAAGTALNMIFAYVEEEVFKRLDELAELEADILATGEPQARVHS